MTYFSQAVASRLYALPEAGECVVSLYHALPEAREYVVS